MSKKYHRYSPDNVICPTCGSVVRKCGVGVARCLACGAEISDDAQVAPAGIDLTSGPGAIAAPGAPAKPGE